MAGTLPVAGHRALHAVEVDPVGAPGTFTTVPEVTSSIDNATTRDTSDISAHADVADRHLVSELIKRDVVSMEITFKYGNTVHAALSSHYYDKVKFGLMTVGPDGTAPTADTIIQSGELISFSKAAPISAGAYKVTAQFRPTGRFKVNGTLYGTDD